jgi:hypothetical protein
MPRNKVTDLVTDQEMLFVRLFMSGTMTDRQAAEAAGLNPDTAAYTKSKPRVHAYMLEYRAAVQRQLAQQEAEELRRQSISREQVLGRLWEIANLSPEITRNSINGQIKALSMIVAIEGLIPNHAAKPFPKSNLFDSPQVPEQEAHAASLQPDPVPHQEEPAISHPPPAPSPSFSSNQLNPYDFAYLSETLSSGVLDPTAAFSIRKEKPYVQRY